ncbi:unnamed protein product [Protopolystoma xenopodis]|uniref:Glycosyl transferase family 25 domain-containing protein n=1 Tax=Protopolystoma xenopodis TaxID=117903 RepID=A0A3S5CNK3_9PLAT|nr:unnamed protein product [Protopolystoma xenopodis]
MPVDESDVEAMQATGNDAELIEVSAIDATSSEAHWLARDVELFTHLRLQAMLDQEDRWRVIAAPSLNATAESHLPVMSKLGFDEVYMINLIRRPDRRSQMDYALSQVGVKARHVPAVDGLELNHARVEALGIRQLPGYADPYHKRPLKFGEIGCFLSHYSLWQVSLLFALSEASPSVRLLF